MCLGLAGWAAALLLLVRWWGQLQAKADSPESSPLLEDESVVLHSSQHSLDPPGEHHSRYHAAPHSSDQAEAGLIEQQGTGGYEGSDTSRASSCNRGVLPGLSKRRRLPTTTPTSLHGQCGLASSPANAGCCPLGALSDTLIATFVSINGLQVLNYRVEAVSYP